MKKLFIYLLLLCLTPALLGCGGGAYESGGDGIQVVATLFPAYDFAREIGGERLHLTLLVPPGAEAHSFEPTPQDMLRIQNCDLLICNGGESEAWLEELRQGLDIQPETLVMLDCVQTLREELKEGMQSQGHEGHEDHAEEAEYDEHVWTSPVNAMVICRRLCGLLSQADPEGKEYYEANLQRYLGELEELDRGFREAVENGSRSTVIFADRFPVRYFTEEYGLDYYAAFPGCADDAEPSARTVAFLIDKVREEEIPAVFYIEFSDERMARLLREDTGCETLLFHSCHNVSREQLDEGISYLELMRTNLENLKEALG